MTFYHYYSPYSLRHSTTFIPLIYYDTPPLFITTLNHYHSPCSLGHATTIIPSIAVIQPSFGSEITPLENYHRWSVAEIRLHLGEPLPYMQSGRSGENYHRCCTSASRLRHWRTILSAKWLSYKQRFSLQKQFPIVDVVVVVVVLDGLCFFVCVFL